MLVTRKNYQNGLDVLMNQLFDNDYINRIENSFNIARPKANIQELETAFKIDLVVPGFKKEDFEIEVVDNQLKVSAKVKTESKNESTNFTHQEFAWKTIERSFKLSHKIDSSNISASYSNGILSLDIPKKEEAIIKRMIEIK